MRQPERQQLENVLFELFEIQQVTPYSTTYNKGHVSANIRTRLQGVIEEIEEVLNVRITEPE